MLSVMPEDTMGLCTMRHNEEFDFDFDLTPRLEDEDNFIEDAYSTDYSVTSQANESPAGNDYFINNDDYSKSIEEFEETETIGDSKISKKDNDTMSMATENDLNIDVIQKDPEIISDQIYQEYTWRNQREESIDDLPENDVANDEIWRNDDKFAENTYDFLGQEPKVSPQDKEDLQEVLPQEQSNSALIAPLNLQATASDSSDCPIMTEDEKQSHLLVPSLSNNSQNFLSKCDSSDEFIDLSIVTVIYQLNEYPLFASSETDDPNTFFIKDHTIARKPLSDFFRAIRDVVHEDLDDESELFLSIPEFGLQVEETSSLLENVTILELVSLRKNLVLNDGIHTPQPMYIDLGTRKNFVKELTRITKVANEGKGLSELFGWNDNGEDANDSLNESDSRPLCEKHFRHSENTIDEEPEENYSNKETEYTNGAGIQDVEGLYSEKASEPEPEQSQQVQTDTSNLTTRETILRRASLNIISAETYKDENTSLIEARPKKLARVANSFYDTENDMIDYSEDEFEHGKESSVYTSIMDNDHKFNPNFDSNHLAVKPSSITAGENKNSSVSNVCRSMSECDSFLKDDKNNLSEQNYEYSQNKIDTSKDNDHLASGENIYRHKNRHRDKKFSFSPEPITDLPIYVDIPSEGHFGDYEPNVVELNCMGEQNVGDGESVSLEGTEHKRTSHKNKVNITHTKIGDLPTEEESTVSHEIVDKMRKEATTTLPMEVSKTSKGLKTSSDECFEESLEDQSLEQNIVPLDFVINEEDNEINYEEDEDEDEEEEHRFEEYQVETEELSSKSSRQPVTKATTSTNWKRSRADYILDITMDKRDLKRTRS